ncbi:MAG: spermidine synthase, partial [Planctomycetota bacterium]|nr:spermidine synthase [Planctomycetota bacterium]
IGTLLVLSVVAVRGLMPRGAGFAEVHFFFMGVGFLLLQTRSISTCSLYFGATWMVTTVIIIGVLLMVLLANYVVLHHLRSFSRRLYIPLLISLAVVYLIPTNLILSLPLVGRVAWSMLGVPLPIFFAGLIFSTTFRSSPNPSAAFGANLIGATIGGFLEYLGMAIGHQALGLIVMGAYVASFIFVGWGASTGRAGGVSPLNS